MKNILSVDERLNLITEGLIMKKDDAIDTSNDMVYFRLETIIDIIEVLQMAQIKLNKYE